MMPQDSPEAEEQTIRQLVTKCRDGQAVIGGLLKENFAREPQVEPKGEDRPVQPNVLDEIIDGLLILNDSQRHTIDFIASSINPKL